MKRNRQLIFASARLQPCLQCMQTDCLHHTQHRSCSQLSCNLPRFASTSTPRPPSRLTSKASRRDLLLLSTGRAVLGLQQVRALPSLQLYVQ